MHCVSRGGCYLVNSYCDLQEDNHWKRESYQAYWLSLVIETRPQYKLTLSETDNSRRESYKQQQVVHFTVERSPSQKLRLGSHNSTMTEHHPPFFNTTRDLHHATAIFRPPPQKQQQQQQPAVLQKLIGGVDKQEVAQDLNKPVTINFRASSLMSSPREISHRMQRRE